MSLKNEKLGSQNEATLFFFAIFAYWVLISPANRCNVYCGLLQSLLWVVAVSVMGGKEILRRVMGDTGTGERRYCNEW
jgi:hypothetical protein